MHVHDLSEWQEKEDDENDDANAETFYGENFVKHAMERGDELSDLEICERQILSMRLYEVSCFVVGSLCILSVLAERRRDKAST